MKSNRLPAWALLAPAIVGLSLFAAEPNAIRDELASIIGSIRDKSAKSQTAPSDLAPEMKRFDDLLAAHATEKTEDVAQVMYSQADFYLRVVKDPAKAGAIAERLKKDLPQTAAGSRADRFLTSVKQAPPPPPVVELERESIRGRIQAKLRDGKTEEADFAPELAAFDALYNAHKAEKTEDVAQILFLKASFYAQVLKNVEKATAIADEAKKGFPGTKAAAQADSMFAGLAQQAAAAKIQEMLTIGSIFPEFSEKDTAGQPLSVGRFKGKVVLVDFWAMWCGPCLAELPNVVKTYEKYHAQGFEIIGVSLDHDGEEAKLAKFTKDNKMPWAQYFDGKFWSTKLAQAYGVNSIPATFLLDGEGRIIARNLRGAALDAAVAKALKK